MIHSFSRTVSREEPIKSETSTTSLTSEVVLIPLLHPVERRNSIMRHVYIVHTYVLNISLTFEFDEIIYTPRYLPRHCYAVELNHAQN